MADDKKSLDHGVEVLETAPAAHDRPPPQLAYTPDQSKRVRRRIDLHIMSIMFVTYCLQFLDKASLSYASVFGLISDTGLVGQQYPWLGSIVYVAQLVSQPIISFALVKLPLGKFLGIMVFLWGSTLTAMVGATEFKGLLAARFFLGAFESSIAPTFIAAVQMWWTREEQTVRNAIWYSTLGIVNMFGSLLAFGLGHIHSDILRPYQTIFLFCGAITVLFSSVVFFCMPDTIASARFLSAQDKHIAHARVVTNHQGRNLARVWRWAHVAEAFADLKTYLWFALIFSISIPSGGISTFGPLIVQGFGFDSFTTILFNMPFGFVQFLATLGAAWAATRVQARGPLIALCTVPPIIGCAILLATDHVSGSKGLMLFAYYIISFYPAITPLIYSWSAANTAGDTKRKVVTGVLFVGQSAGNIVGPNLYSTAEKPQYTRGLLSNLCMFVVIVLLVGATMAWVRVLNRLRSDSTHVRADGTVLVEDDDSDDVTDGQNPRFQFVY